MAKYPVEIRYEMEFAKPPLRGLKERVVASEILDLDIPEVAAARMLVRGKVRDQWHQDGIDFECVESGGRTWIRRDPADEDESDLSALLYRHVHRPPYSVDIPYKVSRYGARPRSQLVGRAAVVHDGREEAVCRHRRAVEGLLLVGGRLFRRGPLPEWYVGRMRTMAGEANRVRLCTPFTNYGEVPCGRFPYDRLDEAIAFSETLHESLRGHAAWMPRDTHLCGSTVEVCEPGRFASPGLVASTVWQEMAQEFGRLEIHKVGFDLLSVYHAAESASRKLEVSPDDPGALAALEGAMRGIAEWKVEGRTIVPTTLDNVRPMIETYELYRRMTEQLNPEDVEALSP